MTAKSTSAPGLADRLLAHGETNRLAGADRWDFSDYPLRLNELVLKKTLDAVKKSEETGKPLAQEFVVVQERMKKYGYHDVYKTQNEWIVYFFALTSIYLIVANSPTYFTMFSMGVMMMIWYDFYSGVLHIVLDHPRHMLWPVLDEPCLEFQWHHHIPHDIADKPFVQACGDLNVAVLLMGGINFLIMGLMWNPLGSVVMSWKLLNAYLGQYNHRTSHMTKKDKHPLAVYAQSVGLLLSDKAHRIHHQGIHDSNFCIGLGLLNDQLNWFTKNVCGNPSLWGIWFIFVSIFDVWAITWAIEAYGGPIFNGPPATALVQATVNATLAAAM